MEASMKVLLRHFVFILIFTSLLAGMAGITPARAASIVVNTNADTIADDGFCTLREAIIAANTDTASGATAGECAAGASADTITFAADYTITLTSGSQLPAVNTTITINGNGAAKTIIQANNAANTASYRVLEVKGTPGSNLTLNGVTIRNGVCAGGCEVFVNLGGGIYNEGILTITNSTIANNSTSYRGGGIYNSGTATLTNVTFSDNSAGQEGGGIFNSNSSPALTNVTFSGNTASYGGGMHNLNSSPTLTNVTFSGNTATVSGGGMYNANSNPILTDVTFSDNLSNTTGGGMLNLSSNPTLTNVTFSGNTATTFGGGMLNFNNSSPTLTNVTFSGNTAFEGGGMLNLNNSSPTLTNVTFSGNTAIEGGGGMHNLNSSPTLTDVTFSSNTATNGGGMYSDTNSSPNLTNVTFSGNTASSFGGGMHNNSSSPALTSVTFSGNSATLGGGMYNTSGSSPTLTNVIIANSASGGDCVNSNSSLNPASANNLIESTGANSCDLTDGNNGNIIGQDPSLGSLANNGGLTQTHALLAGSPAIDAGANCPATDQRGVTRPQGAGCDIGAYEFGAIIPIVTASNPGANATLASLSAITVVFNQDMLDNASTDGAENVNNYIFVERGANASFDTTSCAGGVVSDDAQQTIASASYNSAGFITTLTLASPLTAGTYRLFVCGTTSIWSAAGLELNNGAFDYTVDFTITGTGTGTPTTQATTAAALPATGFAPQRVTALPPQPPGAVYSALDDIWLEIPSLNVKSPIVGVPQADDNTWDVTWLGNSTGWLNGTAFPTWKGNSVLTAHIYNASGLEGPFAALKLLKHGDQIIVHLFGGQYVYEVRDSRLARPYSTSYAFQSLQDHSYLTLITCQFYNPLNESYLFRRVVRAVLVEVK
jgi:LPXTG-site transpeptidase (sortase) family protein